MGASYANVMLLGASVDGVVANVEPPAFVATDGPAVVLFAEGDESGRPTAERLTRVLECTALTVTVFDSDLLMFQVHQRGELVAAGAVPDPAELFDVGGQDPYEAPDPASLVEALGRGTISSVAAALHDDFLYADERHVALLRALDLPYFSVVLGYGYLAGDPSLYEGPQPLRRVE